MQPDDNNSLMVFDYWAQTLCSAQRNYDMTERECFSIVLDALLLLLSLQHDKCFFRTDHSALRWGSNLTKATRRIARWLLHLLEFDSEVMHRTGIAHQALTRCLGCTRPASTLCPWRTKFPPCVYTCPSRTIFSTTRTTTTSIAVQQDL